MNKIRNIIQHIAPTLASALAGPFSGVALKFIGENLGDFESTDDANTEEAILNLLDNSKNLVNIKGIELKLKEEIKALGVDVFSLKENEVVTLVKKNNTEHIIYRGLLSNDSLYIFSRSQRYYQYE